MYWKNATAWIIGLVAGLSCATELAGVTRAGSIRFSQPAAGFGIVSQHVAAPIYVDRADFAGVIRAVDDFADDIHKVTGVTARVTRWERGKQGVLASGPILIGTIGHSEIIKSLIESHKLDVSAIQGKWESCITQLVDHPLPGVESALVIVGSDKRGTIFGIYQLSREMGVSPWYWWADVPVPHHEEIFMLLESVGPSGVQAEVQGPPAVKYRGIFLNDEAPALTGWSREKFGGLNHQMYVRVFELLLRLRANYLWPAMWGNAFNEDDLLNAKLADEYGIVMGTSHQEPMMRAQAEWDRRHHGSDWNFATDPSGMQQFWREGIRRNKPFENLITLGMRGRNDTPMLKDATTQQSMALLEKIVAAQRNIISAEVNSDVTQVPQMWCLYKEVQEYYEQGLRVPDDVTLLWSDDNWGNIRRLPTAAERQRRGGAGIYYHFDYVGEPRSYKWLNTNPLPKVWEQMTLAHQYGANQIWIVNVGDLKPMELPIDFFLSLAWNPDAIGPDQVGEFTERWAREQFGDSHARAIAEILSKYAKYNGWKKPELIDAQTFSQTHDHEADGVWDAWQSLVDRAEQIGLQLPAEYDDAFEQVVLYPTKASATVTQMYIAQGRNLKFAKQHRASTNEQAAMVQALFAVDHQLSHHYNHDVHFGKWNHMMDQSHIGYTTWKDPPENVLPATQRIQVPAEALLGAGVEDSESSWPGTTEPPTLPTFDSMNRQRYAIDLFNRGQKPFAFSVQADQPWVMLSETSGQLTDDRQLWVTIDWSGAPAGTSKAAVTISQKDGESVVVHLQAINASPAPVESANAFGGLTGPISIAAGAATRNIAAGEVCWKEIPDYGRGKSGMTIFPMTAASVLPPTQSPCLQYDVYLAKAGNVQVDLITGPSMNCVPGRGSRVGVSMDDQLPQVLDLFGGEAGSREAWKRAVIDSARTVVSTHTIAKSGRHVLKIWMVDPGIVVQKLIIHRDPLPASYFGPPAADAQNGMDQPGIKSPKPGVNPNERATTRQGDATVPSPRTDANSMAGHQQLVSKAKTRGIDLYFLGDSITRRWGCTDPQWAELKANWDHNFFGWNAADFGWGGDRIENMLWRINNGELDGVNPKVIVILAGTNNVGTQPGDEAKQRNIISGLQALISSCQQKAPESRIILTGIFPRNDSMAVMPEINRINAQLAKLDDQKTIYYININARLADADGKLIEGLTVDQLHLTAKGYQLWADALKPVLKKLLGPPSTTDHAPLATGDPSVK